FTRFCFFFSSRRRHTRFKCDWSSDVCSSDLAYFETVASNCPRSTASAIFWRSEEHTSELQSHLNLVCRLLLEKKKKKLSLWRARCGIWKPILRCMCFTRK